MNNNEIKATTFEIYGKELSCEDIAMLSIAAAIDKKAYRPIVMDLKNVGAFTEYFAIVSASNQRQVYAIAENVKHFFKNHLGLKPVSIDGLESCTWVLIDYGFLFVHIFQESTRDLYQLEQLWNKARVLPVVENNINSLYQSLITSSASTEASGSELMQSQIL